MRDTFETDTETVWVVLEQELQNTTGWKHISKSRNDKDGRDIVKTYKIHYQGPQYDDIIHIEVLTMLKNNIYKEEKHKFNFKNILQVIWLDMAFYTKSNIHLMMVWMKLAK